MTRSAWATALGGLIALGCGDDFSARGAPRSAGGAGKAAVSAGAGSGGSEPIAQAGAREDGGDSNSTGGSGTVVGTPKGGSGGAGGHSPSKGGSGGKATGGSKSSGGSGGTGADDQGAAGEPEAGATSSGGSGVVGGSGGMGDAGGGNVGCNDDPVLVTIRAYAPSEYVELDGDGRFFHSLTTWFKGPKQLCRDAYGGTEVGVWLGDGEAGDFPLSPENICLADDQGASGASFKTTPESYPGDTTLQWYVKDWQVSQYCLRVSVNWFAHTSDGVLASIDETWEVHGTGTPYP